MNLYENLPFFEHLESEKESKNDTVMINDIEMCIESKNDNNLIHRESRTNYDEKNENIKGSESEYRCQICFDDKPSNEGFTLTCNHTFCKECLISYLNSKISDGNVEPECCFIIEKDVKNNDNSAYKIATENKTYETCKQKIPPDTIIEIFKNSKKSEKTIKKYERYKFKRDNKTARECPYCGELNIADLEKNGAKMICKNCAKIQCFYHSNAHDFDIYPTCAEYESAIKPQLQESENFINSKTKPCPKCKLHVIKSGGCNHMKCQCGTAFCWLCGKEIEDALFPSHFQWWNPSGCSNLQMNESLEPTTSARVCARILSIIQIIILGPLTLASTLVSSIICLGCITIVIKSTPDLNLFTGNRNVFSSCMSGWGIFWMILILFIPLVILGGSLFLTFSLIFVIITYPCYVAIRLNQRRYPWPDSLTRCFSRTLHASRSWWQYNINQIRRPNAELYRPQSTDRNSINLTDRNLTGFNLMDRNSFSSLSVAEVDKEIKKELMIKNNIPEFQFKDLNETDIEEQKINEKEILKNDINNDKNVDDNENKIVSDIMEEIVATLVIENEF